MVIAVTHGVSPVITKIGREIVKSMRREDLRLRKKLQLMKENILLKKKYENYHARSVN